MLFEHHGLPLDPSLSDPLRAEFDRRGLTVEKSVNIDLPEDLEQTVKRKDRDGKIVAYGHGRDARQAAIIAFDHFLSGKHDRQLRAGSKRKFQNLTKIFPRTHGKPVAGNRNLTRQAFVRLRPLS